MQTFKEYVAEKTSAALKTEHFNPKGNSDLATYNKGFKSLNVYLESAKGLYKAMKYEYTKNPLDFTVRDIISVIIVVPLFPVFVVSRTLFSYSRAKKELVIGYRKQLTL